VALGLLKVGQLLVQIKVEGLEDLFVLVFNSTNRRVDCLRMVCLACDFFGHILFCALPLSIKQLVHEFKNFLPLHRFAFVNDFSGLIIQASLLIRCKEALLSLLVASARKALLIELHSNCFGHLKKPVLCGQDVLISQRLFLQPKQVHFAFVPFILKPQRLGHEL
jgi:hypothetical protein